MQQKDLRTYQRRGVTRESGYHTCEETTGGECIIAHAFQFICKNIETVFTFKRSTLDVVELFENGITIPSKISRRTNRLKGAAADTAAVVGDQVHVGNYGYAAFQKRRHIVYGEIHSQADRFGK